MNINLEVKKAYDRTTWEFIEKSFSDLNFFRDGQNWIIECIMITSFRVLVIGIPGEPLGQGEVRHGDPIFLYIFITCVKYLGRYIHFTAKDPKILKLKNGPVIAYLLFVHDCVIFCKQTRKRQHM